MSLVSASSSEEIMMTSSSFSSSEEMTMTSAGSVVRARREVEPRVEVAAEVDAVEGLGLNLTEALFEREGGILKPMLNRASSVIVWSVCQRTNSEPRHQPNLVRGFESELQKYRRYAIGHVEKYVAVWRAITSRLIETSRYPNTIMRGMRVRKDIEYMELESSIPKP